MNAKSQQLLTFAREFRERCEAEGLGTQYPTVRECALFLKVPQRVVISMAEDLKNQDYPVDILVGYRTGNGHATHKNIGDYHIEVYDDAPPLAARLLTPPIVIKRDGVPVSLGYNNLTDSIDFVVNGRCLCEIDEEILDELIARAKKK